MIDFFFIKNKNKNMHYICQIEFELCTVKLTTNN